MKRTRGLWASIIFVGILVVASLIGFFTGALAPKLGLDLEGGVSVILSAPAATPKDVMEQALTNIRNRVDAFGVGEPQIFLSGTTIDVQIPGSANGTVDERAADLDCLVGPAETNHGCADDPETASSALAELKVVTVPAEVCIEDPKGTRLGDCLSTQDEADAQLATYTVAPKTEPSATPSSGPSPAGDAGTFCIADASGTELACYPTKKAANDAKDGAATVVTENTYCVAPDGAASSPTVEPSPSATPSPSSSGSPSVSASPTPAPTAFSKLDQDGAQPLPCGLASKDAAASALSAIQVKHVSTQYCVTSSAGQAQGCFISREAADEQQRRLGQDRLLSVIGKTARLEQRPVLAVIAPGDPTYETTVVTCATEKQRATKGCSYQALDPKEVVYLGQSGEKYRLGPVVLSGDQVTKATAVLSGGTQTQAITEWTVEFQLDSDGAKSFADATTAAVSQAPPQNQIAIVVDRQVISAPRVINPITDGRGVITGGFTEQEAKDLATVLNAGALPVELTRQSVQTVSPTLGQESLKQGIVAGLVGLILLFLYLLFYYRLLGIVAWLGMSIWAILALALVSLAGIEFGYALTLAGVAGLVISLGVTADSYIVFFERLKDEVRGGRSARASVQPAFKRAYRTIVAADIVTGIAAVVLYLTAVSSVRGFALTLGVATLLDLFVVWFFKRPTVFLIARNERLVNLRGFGLTSGVAGEPEPDDIVAVTAPGDA